MNLGTYAAGATFDFEFNSHKADGTPITLAGTPSLACYKANSTTQTTTGLTLDVDFDAVTGLNHVRVVTSDDFYATGNEYDIVIAAGTVDSVSVVGSVVGHFALGVVQTIVQTIDAGSSAFRDVVTDAVLDRLPGVSELTIRQALAILTKMVTP